MKNFYKIFIAVFSLFVILAFTADNTNPKNKLILDVLKQTLKAYHYQDYDIDNVFSEEVFKLYIEKLDYNKRFFIQSDINEFGAYKYKIDEAVKEGDFTFFELSKKTYLERVQELNKYIEAALKKPFDIWNGFRN